VFDARMSESRSWMLTGVAMDSKICSMQDSVAASQAAMQAQQMASAVFHNNITCPACCCKAVGTYNSSALPAGNKRHTTQIGWRSTYDTNLAQRRCFVGLYERGDVCVCVSRQHSQCATSSMLQAPKSCRHAAACEMTNRLHRTPVRLAALRQAARPLGRQHCLEGASWDQTAA
jgi:hypothetical protein